MLDIIYFSNITENTHKFVQKVQQFVALNHDTVMLTRIPIKGELDSEQNPTRPYILICPTYGSETTGHVPPQVKKFLRAADNAAHATAVIGAGNINFGHEYAAAGFKLAHHLNIPLLYNFELIGFDADVQNVHTLINKHEQTVLLTV